MVPRPQAHPSPLHWAAAKVSDKREVSLPRPPEERQTTWPAMGGFWELMFLKEAGEGVLSRSRSPGTPHNCSCPSWLQPRHSFLKIHVMQQLPKFTVPALLRCQCDTDTKMSTCFRLSDFVWCFRSHCLGFNWWKIITKFNCTSKTLYSVSAVVLAESHCAIKKIYATSIIKMGHTCHMKPSLCYKKGQCPSLRVHPEVFFFILTTKCLGFVLISLV